MKATEKRSNYIDIARGIAIWFIVLAHTDWCTDYCMSWSNAVLSSFFVISGILLPFSCKKELSVKEFAKNRCKRLLYPYMTFSLIYLIVMSAFAILTEGSNGVETAVKNVIDVCTMNGLMVTWYFPASFGAEVIAYSVFQKKKPKIHLLLAVLVAAILTGAFSYVSADVLAKQDANLGIYTAVCVLMLVIDCLIAFVFVGVGLLVSDVILKNDRILLVNLVCMIAFFSVAFFCGLHLGDTFIDDCEMGNPVLFYIEFIMMSLGMIELSKVIGHNKILEFFGKNSMIIMLTHIPVPILVSSILYGIITTIVPDVKIYVVVLPLLVVLMLVELPFIKLINKRLSFLLIKKEKTKVKTKVAA